MDASIILFLFLGDCCLPESDFSICLLCTCYEKEDPVTFDDITFITFTTAKDKITDPTQVNSVANSLLKEICKSFGNFHP